MCLGEHRIRAIHPTSDLSIGSGCSLSSLRPPASPQAPRRWHLPGKKLPSLGGAGAAETVRVQGEIKRSTRAAAGAVQCGSTSRATLTAAVAILLTSDGEPRSGSACPQGWGADRRTGRHGRRKKALPGRDRGHGRGKGHRDPRGGPASRMPLLHPRRRADPAGLEAHLESRAAKIRSCPDRLTLELRCRSVPVPARRFPPEDIATRAAEARLLHDRPCWISMGSQPGAPRFLEECTTSRSRPLR